ncbi:MAG: hypothetical protein QOF76_113 [Solirubrobacteraceae bacterium]|nr:hypothetical protein [Solirubrobacteraceae bacterium]
MINGAISHWWAALPTEPRRAPLPGPTEADVAIVGAGYTGLWTAYYLKRARPDWRVVVLERESAGFGASGRNGGWLSGLLAGSRERYAQTHGRAAVVAAQRAMFAAVGEVEAVCAAEGIDCDLVRGGSLDVARSPTAAKRLAERLADQRAWGFGEEDWRALDASEVRARVGVRSAVSGVFTPHCARVQPAKLIRGLAAAAERAGVEIFEGTPVVALGPHVATTPYGDVRAPWIVRATEGYTAGLPGLRRRLVPMNSSMVVTAPIAGLGWAGAETLRDADHVFSYLQRTADGRVAIGGRGVPYRFGSRTDRAGEVAPRTVTALRDRLEAILGLGDVALDHAWGGVLGVARDWCPAVGANPATGIAWAGGYVGDGVSTANLAGRTLRDLLLREDTELARLPWVGHASPDWEPEPLRYLGVRTVYGLYRAADWHEARTHRSSPFAAVAGLLAGR